MSDGKVQKRPPRGPYAKTEAVRERIIDAATAEFAEVGYLPATMKAIAARAEISERGLAHHFRGKDELRAALLERRDRATSGAFPREAGLGFLLTLWRLVLEDSAGRTISELQTTVIAEAVSPAHDQHVHQRDKYELIRHYATASFEALDERGELASSLSPRELATMFVALLDGLQVQWLYEPDAVDPAALLHRFLESVIPALHEQGMAESRDRTRLTASGSR